MFELFDLTRLWARQGDRPNRPISSMPKVDLSGLNCRNSVAYQGHDDSLFSNHPILILELYLKAI